jgi:hypothetical protein
MNAQNKLRYLWLVLCVFLYLGMTTAPVASVGPGVQLYCAADQQALI